MKTIFDIGDIQTFHRVVSKMDTASFEGSEVHPVYATFAIGRDAEWAGRLFVLAMKAANEEGIGTFLHIEHHAPAFVGEEVVFTAILKEVNGNNVVCDFNAKVRERMIAYGSTGQKIIAKDKLEKHFEKILSGS
jgi:fluoroacetyl-CoA thioesterase